METVRLSAIKTVRRVIEDNAYSLIELTNNINGVSENPVDRALYSAIVRTVIERKNTLDFVIDLCCRKRPDSITVCILYVGIAQLLFMDKIPDNAACDETVKAAKALVDTKRCGFVNGVLRNICRSREEIAEKINTSDESVKYSLNKSICKMLKIQYPEHYKECLDIIFNKPNLCVRVNTLKTTVGELENLFAENGIEFKSEGTLIRVFSGREKVVSLAVSGLFFVQGYPSQQAVKALEARKGMTVIDVCACPGGKTLGAAIDMENSGSVISLDIHENKLSLIEKSAHNLGINIVSVSAADSRIYNEKYSEKADRVICDVPCSSLGVFASKPEIRYKDISSLEALYKTQKEILHTSSRYVKPGGRLVYSTCTFNKNENTNQIEEFLRENTAFSLVSEKQLLCENGYFDGFYIAVIERIK